MYSNWIGAMDALAANGVIDFDAPAFILDKSPRYIGHPSLERLPLEPTYLPPGIKMKDVAQSDEFGNDKNLVKNPGWKKWLVGGTIVATLAGLAITIATRGKNKPQLFGKDGIIDFSKIIDKIKNFKIKK